MVVGRFSRVPARRTSTLPALRALPVLRTLRRLRGRHQRSGLAGPLLLAVLLAGTGHWVAGRDSAAAAADTRPVALLTTELTPRSAFTVLRDGELLAALRASAAAPAAARPAAAAPPRRTPARASRSTRTAPRRAAAAVAPRPTGRWVRPCRGALTSGYGPRWGRMHRGVDLCGNHGIPVYAAGDGVVIHAGYGLSGYGKQVQIRHANGAVTSYSHLSAITVSGGRVSAGTLIGRTGSTGNVTGPHLHLEVKVNGVAVNPSSWFRARGVNL
jgi:murein DD-endopeptidase MepM/ murein hydrolase activator NlpD